MRHDPASDFRDALVEVMTLGRPMEEEAATRFAERVSERYLACVDLGGAHFELLEVTLRWKALCGDLVNGALVLSLDRFAGLPLIGALRWLDQMRYYHQLGAPPSPNPADLDHVAAATCMAFWKLDSGPRPPAREHPFETLLHLVDEVLLGAALGTVDRQRLRAAVDRLRTVGCLTAHAGWYGLREEMRFQVPEE